MSTAPSPPCALTFQGWMYCVPTATGASSINVTVTDNNGATASETVSFTAGNTLQLGRIDPVDGVLHLPSIIANNPLRAVMHAYGGTPPYTFSAIGLPSWASINSSTGTITGTPTVSGSASFIVTVTDSATDTASATAIVNVGLSAIAQRPAYNTGSGFFVLNGQLYDPNGHLFHVRGTNQLHYDSGMQQDVPYSGANTVRLWDGNFSTSTYLSISNTYIGNGVLVDVGMAYVPSTGTPSCPGNGTSGDNNTSDLDSVVAWWVSNESAFTPIMNAMTLNIANEWGGSGAGKDCVGASLTLAQWAAEYEKVIPELRTAGWRCPIVIDTYDQGEDTLSFIQYASAIIASDPQKNVIFGWHPYQTMAYNEARIASVITGSSTKIFLESNASSAPLPNYAGGYYIYNAQGLTQLNGFASGNTASGSAGAYTITLNTNSSAWTGSYVADSATIVLDNGDSGTGRGDMHYRRAGDLIASAQIPVMIEEGAGSTLDSMGGGSDASVSAVSADWAQKVSAFESYGLIGYLNWAWDDNNLTGDKTGWGNAYGYAFNNPTYTGNPAQLTAPGLDVLLNPREGLDALGSPASSL